MSYPRRLTLMTILLLAGVGITGNPGESSTRVEAVE